MYRCAFAAGGDAEQITIYQAPKASPAQAGGIGAAPSEGSPRPPEAAHRHRTFTTGAGGSVAPYDVGGENQLN